MKFLIFPFTILVVVAIVSANKQDDALNYVRNYYKKLEQKQLASDESFICNECTTVMTDLKSAIEDSAKYMKFKHALNLVCMFFTGTAATECKNTVSILDSYLGKVKSLLDQPTFVCQQMHLCSSTIEPPIGCRVLVTGLKALLTSSTNSYSESEQCDQCVLVINTIYAILADRGVQNVLKVVATKICTIIPTYTGDCTELIDQNFATVMNKIEEKLFDPIQVCTALFVCRSKETFLEAIQGKPMLQSYPRLRRTLLTLPKLQTPSGDSSACSACTITLTTLIAILNQPKIVEGVSTGIRLLVCQDIMPSAIYPSCSDFFEIYLPSVLLMTYNNWTPDQICTKFKACTNDSAQSFRSMTVYDQSINGCQACQSITGFLASELQQPTIQQDVLNFVKNLVCSRAKSTEAQLQCDSYVDVFGHYIMIDSVPIWLANLCSVLHVCLAN